MAATLSLERGRVHVLTPRFEWTILKAFGQSRRGPCYVSDVRERVKPYRKLVVESTDKRHTVNDPELGGLFGAGIVVAEPPDPVAGEPDDFWSWGWEITSRLNAGASKGFGVVAPFVSARELAGGVVGVEAAQTWHVRGRAAMRVSWSYRFGPKDRVACRVTFKPEARPELWLKEPKVVASSWRHDPRFLTVLDGDGVQLGPVYDLSAYHDPAAHTLQIAPLARRRFELDGGRVPRVLLGFDRGFAKWTAAANEAQPMAEFNSPAYCRRQPDGALWDRFEVARRDANGAPVVGLYDHGWEGGYGAPDCWDTFGPWPSSSATVSAWCEIP